MIGMQLTMTSAGMVRYTKVQMRALMRKVGAEIAAVARAKIRKSVGGGRVYYTAGSSGIGPKHTASAPGDAPSSATGKLANSLKVYPFKSGDGVAIRSRMFYALFLEEGAKGGGGVKGSRNKRGRPGTMRRLLPRPFLSAAVSEREASISQRIHNALINDIAFKRMK